MKLTKAQRKKLGNLAGQASKVISDLILQRGGSASNVNQVGHWANQKLGDAAKAAEAGDKTAETAIKIVKQAKRLGEEH